MGSRACVFKTNNRIQVAKTSKKACVKENADLYLFCLCFGDFHSCVEQFTEANLGLLQHPRWSAL